MHILVAPIQSFDWTDILPRTCPSPSYDKLIGDKDCWSITILVNIALRQVNLGLSNAWNSESRLVLNIDILKCTIIISMWLDHNLA